MKLATSVGATRSSISFGLLIHSTSSSRSRSVVQQIREDLLRNLEEELAPVLRGLEQRYGNCVRLRACPQLFGWSPVRASPVERVEKDVALWVAKNGACTPSPDRRRWQNRPSLESDGASARTRASERNDESLMLSRTGPQLRAVSTTPPHGFEGRHNQLLRLSHANSPTPLHLTPFSNLRRRSGRFSGRPLASVCPDGMTHSATSCWPAIFSNSGR